jgi:UDP-glucuronate decarboxylase
MLELAQLVIELVGSSSDLIFEDLPEDDPRRPRPDIAIARRALSWEPTLAARTG